MNAHNMAAFIDGPFKRYRYWLKRRVGLGKRLIVWIMLNPSTAEHRTNDATIRRVLRFSKDWGFDLVIVLNMYAYRATSPKRLMRVMKKRGADHVFGEDNQFWHDYWLERADRVLIGWGGNINIHPLETMQIFPQAYCLGVTRSLQPKHPLMIAANTQPVTYESAIKHLERGI